MRRRATLALALVLARPVRAQGPDGGGLARLAAVLEKQWSGRKGPLALPWKESILTPATARLVWYPRRLAPRPGGDAVRLAFDPLTQWYFVAQVSAGSPRPRYFGPLEERGKGHFVEAFDAPYTPARPQGAKRSPS